MFAVVYNSAKRSAVMHVKDNGVRRARAQRSAFSITCGRLPPPRFYDVAICIASIIESNPPAVDSMVERLNGRLNSIALRPI